MSSGACAVEIDYEGPMAPRTGLLLCASVLASCAAMKTVSEFPPEARRKTAPAGLEGALPVGAVAPQLSIAMTDGTSASLRGGHTALIFYRGRW